MCTMDQSTFVGRQTTDRSKEIFSLSIRTIYSVEVLLRLADPHEPRRQKTWARLTWSSARVMAQIGYLAASELRPVTCPALLSSLTYVNLLDGLLSFIYQHLSQSVFSLISRSEVRATRGITTRTINHRPDRRTSNCRPTSQSITTPALMQSIVCRQA